MIPPSCWVLLCMHYKHYAFMFYIYRSYILFNVLFIEPSNLKLSFCHQQLFTFWCWMESNSWVRSGLCYLGNVSVLCHECGGSVEIGRTNRGMLSTDMALGVIEEHRVPKDVIVTDHISDHEIAIWGTVCQQIQTRPHRPRGFIEIHPSKKFLL